MNRIKFILFDWGGTLAYSGTRNIFLHSLSLSDKLGVLKKDTIPLLHKLKQHGIKMGIVTNTDKCIGCMLRSLKAMDMRKYFEFVIFSNGNGMCKKPCKKIFTVAIKKTGLSPNEILFVGNDPIKDILGAENVGLHSVFLAETDQIYRFFRKNSLNCKHNIMVHSLSDIIGLLTSH